MPDRGVAVKKYTTKQGAVREDIILKVNNDGHEKKYSHTL